MNREFYELVPSTINADSQRLRLMRVIIDAVDEPETIDFLTIIREKQRFASYLLLIGRIKPVNI
jgi:hypothetical protein